MNYVDFAAAAETSSKCVLVSEEVALVTAENRVDKENERVIPARGSAHGLRVLSTCF